MKFFRQLTLATLVSVYILILIGGIVRSTGSGMGCPDWPKCFGQWVPPTSVNELPPNYKKVYAAFREKKNVRFAGYLETLGFSKAALIIKTDRSILNEADFNVVKTWVEYVNRLVGVVIGFLILWVFLYSIKYWKWDRKLTILAFTSFFLVCFQGWIGSFVVSTNLMPWTITVHMLLALVLVALLIYLYYLSSKEQYKRTLNFGLSLMWISISLLAIQIVLGTQVREAIDSVASLLPRSEWITAIGLPFLIHRSFSWLVLGAHLFVIWKLYKADGWHLLTIMLGLLVVFSTITGICLAYFSLPAYLQPLHLVLAVLTFGVDFLILLQLRSFKKEIIPT